MPATSLPRPNRLPRGLLSTALLSLFAARAAHAESSITVKNQSWQEDNKRIRVDSQYSQIDAELSPDARLKVMGLIDTIAGATPTGEKAAPGAPVPVSQMEDERKAWDTNLSYQLPRINVTVGYGVSRESDYVSNGTSVNTVTDFNQKNTTLLLGWGHTDDRIMERFWARDRAKTGDDFVAGLTQLLSPHTSVTLNLSYGHVDGFLSDPYKIVSTTRLDLDPGTYYTPPENRPRVKDKGSLFLGLLRDFSDQNAALDASYRYYSDSFGIDAHTVELKWIQRAGTHFVFEPLIRYHLQSAADFYYYDLDRAGVTTSYDPTFETGTGKGPFYSSDYRLSHLETLHVGLKASWIINPHFTVDASLERYFTHGLDRFTPTATYSDANVITFGLKLSR